MFCRLVGMWDDAHLLEGKNYLEQHLAVNSDAALSPLPEEHREVIRRVKMRSEKKSSVSCVNLVLRVKVAFCYWPKIVLNNSANSVKDYVLFLAVEITLLSSSPNK